MVQFYLGMLFSFHSHLYLYKEYFLFVFLLLFSFKINAQLNYNNIEMYDETFSIVENTIFVLVTMKYGLLLITYKELFVSVSGIQKLYKTRMN